MIRQVQDLYLDISRTTDAISKSSKQYTAKKLIFFEGDSLLLNIYFRDYANDTYITLDANEALILSVATEDSLTKSENTYLALSETWNVKTDSDGITYYEGLLNLNTQEVVDALGKRTQANAVFEIVVVRTDLGQQTTWQNEVKLKRSIAPATIMDVLQPSQHIGSYASARQMMEEIADQRILDLKDGAPLEFDTLFELAHYAQKVRSHEIVVGDFDDYIDGKLLADQNLTVSQLSSLAQDESTYTVTHEPWRPRNLTVQVV